MKWMRRKGITASPVRNLSENQIQAKFIAWCNDASLRDRRLKDLEYIFHIPNGSNKSPATRVLFKKIGLKSGVPDIFLPVPSRGYHGLWIEFKSSKGRLSDTQKKYHEALVRLGYQVIVCRMYMQAINLMLDYLELPKIFEEEFL